MCLKMSLIESMSLTEPNHIQTNLRKMQRSLNYLNTAISSKKRDFRTYSAEINANCAIRKTHRIVEYTYNIMQMETYGKYNT